MMLAIVPGLSSAEDDVAKENWPIFRAGYASAQAGSCIAMGANGSVHLAYVYDDPSDPNVIAEGSCISYSVFSNGSWQRRDLCDSPAVTSMDMALDDDGKAHIVCTQRFSDTYELRYWTNANGNWTEEVVQQFDACFILPLSMAVDHQGKVHVVLTYSPPSDHSNCTYHYLTNSAGNWTDEALRTFPGVYDLLEVRPEVEVDRQNNVHIAYQIKTNYTVLDIVGELYGLTFKTRVAGNWTDDHVLWLSDRITRFSMQVGDDGSETIIYHRRNDTFSANGPISLAERLPTRWATWTLGYGFYDCQLILDEQGVEHFAYINEEHDMVLGTHARGSWSFPSRTLLIPYNVYPRPGDFMAGTGNDTSLVYYDSMVGQVVFAKHSDNPSLFPTFNSVRQVDDCFVLDWNDTDAQGGPAVSGYRICSCYPPLFFVTAANVTELIESNVTVPDDYPFKSYRISALNEDGEEYIGGYSEHFLPNENGSEMDVWTILKLAGVILLSAVLLALLGLYMRWLRDRGLRKKR